MDKGKLKWAHDAVDLLRQACHKAALSGEVSHDLSFERRCNHRYSFPSSPSYPVHMPTRATFPSLLSHVTRTSTRHPLRHAVLNVIRKVTDFRAGQLTPVRGDASQNQNGNQYLLTGPTLFTTSPVSCVRWRCYIRA